jgi:hypothetical protein
MEESRRGRRWSRIHGNIASPASAHAQRDRAYSGFVHRIPSSDWIAMVISNQRICVGCIGIAFYASARNTGAHRATLIRAPL